MPAVGGQLPDSLLRFPARHGLGETEGDIMILEKALILSAAEREALVESLLASLDQPDARIDELWAEEAEDRLAAFEAGRMQAYPADLVFQKFEDL